MTGHAKQPRQTYTVMTYHERDVSQTSTPHLKTTGGMNVLENGGYASSVGVNITNPDHGCRQN